MGRLVKCVCCENKIPIETAYKTQVQIKSKEIKFKNVYACSEEEYNNFQQAKLLKKYRAERMRDVINEIIGRENTNTILFNYQRDWLEKEYGLEVIEENRVFLFNTMQSKTFRDEYCMIKYLAAVINNNLNDWVNKMKTEIDNQKYAAAKEKLHFEQFVSKSFKKRKRKCLDDYEE